MLAPCWGLLRASGAAVVGRVSCAVRACGHAPIPARPHGILPHHLHLLLLAPLLTTPLVCGSVVFGGCLWRPFDQWQLPPRPPRPAMTAPPPCTPPARCSSTIRAPWPPLVASNSGPGFCPSRQKSRPCQWLRRPATAQLRRDRSGAAAVPSRVSGMLACAKCIFFSLFSFG